LEERLRRTERSLAVNSVLLLRRSASVLLTEGSSVSAKKRFFEEGKHICGIS
jgi:hypothetical protein